MFIQKYHNFRNLVSRGIFVFLSIWTSLFLGWLVLKSVNFMYPVLYDVLGTKSLIEQYAPKNRLRQNFQATDRAERIRLFQELVDSVHHQGEDLENIKYNDPSGRALGTLLTPAEIIHLKLVSKIIDRFLLSGYFSTLGLIVWEIFRVIRTPPPSPILNSLGYLLSVYASPVLLLLVKGENRLVWLFHHALFPPAHVWTFSADASLMVILINAPIMLMCAGAFLLIISFPINLTLLYFPVVFKTLLAVTHRITGNVMRPL